MYNIGTYIESKHGVTQHVYAAISAQIIMGYMYKDDKRKKKKGKKKWQEKWEKTNRWIKYESLDSKKYYFRAQNQFLIFCSLER